MCNYNPTEATNRNENIMTTTIKKTTSAGVEIKIEWSATMVSTSLDGDCGVSDVDSRGSVELTDSKGNQIVWSNDVSSALKGSLPDMPRGAKGAISGSKVTQGVKGFKEVMQLIGAETYDLIKLAVQEAREIAESELNISEKPAENLIDNPKFAHLTNTEIKAAELSYDNLHNEGGEGFNPYRDSLIIKVPTA